MKTHIGLCLLMILVCATSFSAQSRRKRGGAVTRADASRPSESAGRAFIEGKMKGQPYILRAFKKTNGQSQEVFGVKIYVMEFEADVDCTKVTHSPDALALVGGYNIACRGMGERHTFEGKIRFEKMEKGWRPNQNPDDIHER